MGASERLKGHRFERWVARQLQRVFPQARRQLEYHKADANGVDLQFTGRYRVQCKRYKKYAPITAIEEIADEADIVPVLVTKADNKPAMAVLPLKDFIQLTEAEAQLEWLCLTD